MASALYRLGGRAAKAAGILLAYQNAARTLRPDADRHAQELAVLGLDAPGIAVEHEAGCLPRAYEEYPSILTSEFGDDIFYMYAPLWYDGTHFTPPDSERITGEAEAEVGQRLGGDGWLTPIPVMPRRRRGVPLPADYIPMPAPAREKSAYFHPARFYAADKASLVALKAYERDKAAWKDAMERLLHMAKALVMAEANAQVDAGALQGDGLYVNTSYVLDDTRRIELSLRRDGRGGDVMSGGREIAIPPSRHYIAMHNAHGSGYIIQPRWRFAETGMALTCDAADAGGLPVPEGDMKPTPESVAFTALYDAVPHFPLLSEYGDLAAPDGSAPVHVARGGFDLLIYHVPESVPEFCPRGAKRISHAMHEWMLRDESDRSMGVEPPPMPDALSDKMMNLKVASGAGAGKPRFALT